MLTLNRNICSLRMPNSELVLNQSVKKSCLAPEDFEPYVINPNPFTPHPRQASPHTAF